MNCLRHTFFSRVFLSCCVAALQLNVRQKHPQQIFSMYDKCEVFSSGVRYVAWMTAAAEVMRVAARADSARQRIFLDGLFLLCLVPLATARVLILFYLFCFCSHFISSLLDVPFNAFSLYVVLVGLALLTTAQGNLFLHFLALLLCRLPWAPFPNPSSYFRGTPVCILTSRKNSLSSQ